MDEHKDSHCDEVCVHLYTSQAKSWRIVRLAKTTEELVILVGRLCEFVRTTWWELIEWKESWSAFGSPAAKRDRPFDCHRRTRYNKSYTRVGCFVPTSRALVVIEGRGRTSSAGHLFPLLWAFMVVSNSISIKKLIQWQKLDLSLALSFLVFALFRLA
jgi:hypothetical protein